MKGKKGKNAIQLGILLLLGLGALFSLFTIDTSLLYGSQELLEVSVILRDPDSSAWSTARRGMEQAALDFGVELRVLTLSEGNNTEEQLELLLREVEGGAAGIILVPADPVAMGETVKSISKTIPVVTIESDMSDSGAVGCISVDNQALGLMLGEAVLEDFSGIGTALLVDSTPQSTGVVQRITATATLLEEAGWVVQHCTPTTLPLVVELSSPDVVVTFESTILEQTAQLFTSSGEEALLYGTGSTAVIASYLEKGAIASIVAQNEFSVGYLAVEQVVSGLTSHQATTNDPLQVTLIDKDTMYGESNQKLLFPVTG